jgi:hypothetical protein
VINFIFSNKEHRVKFIFLVLALILVIGCGQNNPPKNPAVTVANVQPTPSPQSDVTKTELVTSDVGSGPGNGPATNNNANNELLPPVSSQIFAPPPELPKTDAEIADANASAFAQQIGFQEKLLYQEQAALDKAVATKDKDVHLTADFVKTAAFGLGTGFLTWDFLKRINVVDRNGWDYLKSIARYRSRRGLSTVPEVGEESAAAAGAATGTSLRAAAFATTEIVSAAVLGLLAVRSAVDLNKDRVIHFSTTEEIQYHDTKVREARKNLAEARANLKAIYFPPPPKHG